MDEATLGWLFLSGLVAGTVDAIAGGGGLITVPALLAAGLSPLQSLSTNKLQSTFGSLAATVNFLRRGYLEPESLLPAVLFTALGAGCGALALLGSDPALLTRLVPFLLIGVALYFAHPASLGGAARRPGMGRRGFFALFGPLLGFYDGFFGPGVGSFWSAAFVGVLGWDLMRAAAHARLVNFTSNAVSLLVFVFSGEMVWMAGLVMAVAQLLGGWLGSHWAMRRGAALIRPLLVLVTLAMSIKLLLSA